MTTSSSHLYTTRDGAKHRSFTLWFMAAVVTFAAATVLIDGGSIGAGAGWAITMVTVVLMLIATGKYVSFLRTADELLRKVHLDALAFGFGAGVVSMMGYRLGERLGAPKLDVNDAALVMLVSWTLGQLAGARRYGAVEEH